MTSKQFLEDKNKDELFAIAASEGVETSSSDTKDELVEKLADEPNAGTEDEVTGEESWRPTEPGVEDKDGAGARDVDQKSQLQTSGTGGAAEENLEHAYEIPEQLQSSNKEEREAGDVSLSEAAKEAKTDEEEELASEVKNQDEDTDDSEE